MLLKIVVVEFVQFLAYPCGKLVEPFQESQDRVQHGNTLVAFFKHTYLCQLSSPCNQLKSTTETQNRQSNSKIEVRFVIFHLPFNMSRLLLNARTGRYASVAF